MDAEERHDIREVKTYVNSKGHEVKAFSQVFGKNQEPTIYRGIANVKVISKGPFGVVPQEFALEFGFAEGTTLKTAFDNFDEAANKAIEAWKKAQEEKAKEASKKIVEARGALPKILGADGTPLIK